MSSIVTTEYKGGHLLWCWIVVSVSQWTCLSCDAQRASVARVSLYAGAAALSIQPTGHTHASHPTLQTDAFGPSPNIFVCDRSNSHSQCTPQCARTPVYLIFTHMFSLKGWSNLYCCLQLRMPQTALRWERCRCLMARGLMSCRHIGAII